MPKHPALPPAQLQLPQLAAPQLKLENKYDSGKLKQALDDTITEHLLQTRHFTEDNRWSDWRIFWGIVAVAVAVFAHFGPLKFPAAVPVLIGCVGVYAVSSAVLQVTTSKFVRDDILITRPSTTAPGIAVSSELEHCGPIYTLKMRIVHSLLRRDIASEKTLTKSVEQWVCQDGVVRKDLVVADVDRLLETVLETTKKTN